MRDERIAAFWSWWAENRPRLDAMLDAGDETGLAEALAPAVAAIDERLAWEIEPGRTAGQALVVTSAGAPDLRPLAHRWVRAAPPADERWEFHPSRQPHPNAMELRIQVGGREFAFDQIVLGMRIPPGKPRLDLVVYHPIYPDLDDETRTESALLALDWILGEDEVGVVTGLAWTPTGGDVLLVEASAVPGTGQLILTGQLGDVMRESARAALTYTRSRHEALGIDPELFQKRDIHVHVPAGAVPKDGPSAGITMASAIVSALTGRPARKRVAMTGEITLRGRVLPIGGLKEKLLAAQRAGVHTVLVPKANEPDLRDVPEETRSQLEIVLVDHMDQVLPRVFGEPVLPQLDGKEQANGAD